VKGRRRGGRRQVWARVGWYPSFARCHCSTKQEDWQMSEVHEVSEHTVDQEADTAIQAGAQAARDVADLLAAAGDADGARAARELADKLGG
jgi:FPC/CPF motif-containing protein YcgG